MLSLDALDAELEKARARIEGSCEKCGGLGSVETGETDDDTLEPALTPCDCRARLVVEVALIDGNVPREFRQPSDFDPFAAGPNAHVADLLRKYADRLAVAREHGLGFLFYGENGVGKTLAACWLLREAARAGASVFYTTAPEWLDAKVRAFRDEDFADWLREKEEADFMVLDELGKEHRREGSSFAPASLDSLIRARASALLPTVAVTNIIDDRGLEESLGASLISILSGRRFRKVEFEPGDFRGATLWEDLLDGEG